MLDELPDLALHEICLHLKAKDISSLQRTQKKFLYFIRDNRLHYRKYNVKGMEILLTKKGQRMVTIHYDTKKGKEKRKTLFGPVDEMIKSLNPYTVRSYDHEELVNMSPLWWKERTKVDLKKILDYRPYLQHLDICTEISLDINHPFILSEVLASMEKKNLKSLMFSGKGEMHCTDDDLRKIGRLSNKMRVLGLSNLSESSNISNDGILDMIEIGSFDDQAAQIFIPQFLNGMNECLKRRNWIKTIIWYRDKYVIIKGENGHSIWIRGT